MLQNRHSVDQSSESQSSLSGCRSDDASEEVLPSFSLDSVENSSLRLTALFDVGLPLLLPDFDFSAIASIFDVPTWLWTYRNPHCCIGFSSF